MLSILLVIVIFLVGCNKGQATGEAYNSQKVQLPAIRDDLKSSAKCYCVTPSHVTIKCANDAWKKDTNFNRLDSIEGLLSAQNGYGAFCVYDKNLVPEINYMKCNSFFKDQNCDQFCKSHLSQKDIEEKIFNLNKCVKYFEDKCDGIATTKGAYEEKFQNGWWTVYGLCGEPSKEFWG